MDMPGSTQNLPELNESKKSLRFAIIQSLSISLVIIAAIFIISNYMIQVIKHDEIEKVKSELVGIMTLVRNSIEPDVADFRTGKATKTDALKKIETKLRQMVYKDRYGENYIFLIDYAGVIYVQPYQPWLEHTNQWNMQDENGKYLIRDIIKVARSNNAGDFSTYYYNPPNMQEQEEKLAFSIDIPELECVIGTGKYMRLYYQKQLEAVRQATLITSLVALFVLLISLSSLRRIQSTAKELEVEIYKRAEIQKKLTESETNLRMVFNSNPDSLILHNEQGEVIEINNRVLDMFGCTREEIIGKTVEIISAPGEFSQEILADVLKEAFMGETPLFEYRGKRLDNQEEFYVEAALRSVDWYGNRVILAVVRDIQDRKFIEKELNRSNLINDQIEKMGNYGYYSIDMKTKEIKWSKGLYEIFKRDVRLPAPGFDEYYSLIEPEDLERVKTTQAESRRSRETQKIEYKIHCPDGTIQTIYHIMDWMHEGGDPYRYILGSIQDVTERNKAFEIIRQREEVFRTTVQQMSDGLVIINADGDVIEWNSAHEQISEIPAEVAIGRKIWEVLPSMGIDHFYSQGLNEMENEIRRSEQNGESTFFHEPDELEIKTPSGKTRALMQTVFPIKTPDKYLIGIVSHDITEQKESLDKINHELNKLASLRSIDAAILERTTPEKTLEMICSIAVDLLHMDGTIILTKLASDNLASSYISKIDTEDDPVIARTLDLQVAALKKFGSQDLSVQKVGMIDQILPVDLSTGMPLNHTIVPLIMNKKVYGYIQAISTEPIPDDQEWKDYFLTLAGQTSIAIENVTLITNEELAYNELNIAYENTIAGWSKALELRDEETKGHSDRVMHLSCRFAEKAGLPLSKMTSFRRGVLLHDIGKMGIPDRILLKPGALTNEDWKIMRLHPVMAYDLLSSIPYLHDSLEIPYSHHEHWDGSGYPQGLKGTEIPLTARIFSIIDVWDALKSDRPYRKGWKPETIIQYLKDNKSVLFDPDLVDMFIDLINEPEFGASASDEEG
jgi:PAS domain S-box-containing protein